MVKLSKVKSSEEMAKKAAQETPAVKTLDEIKKEKNIMNIITNTISENQAQVTAQIQPTKGTTTQISSVKAASVSAGASSSATKPRESLKIKTLEEIKAEKEMKKKLLQQQSSEQKMELAEDKALDSSQDSMEIQIRSPQSESKTQYSLV